MCAQVHLAAKDEFPQYTPLTLHDDVTLSLGKSGRSIRREKFLAGALCDTMRKREFEILSQELLEVWTFDVACLFDFNDLENLVGRVC